MTLLETLVVLTIVAVLAGMASIRLGVWGDTPSPRLTLERVGQAIDGVCEQSLLQGKVHWLTLGTDGLWWLRADPGAQNRQPLVTWPESWQVVVMVEGRNVPLMAIESTSAPQLMCGVLGEQRPFQMTMTDASSRASLSMPISGEWVIEETRR